MSKYESYKYSQHLWRVAPPGGTESVTLCSKRDIALNAILRGFPTPHAAAHVPAGTMVALSTLWRVQPYKDDRVSRTTASAIRNASFTPMSHFPSANTAAVDMHAHGAHDAADHLHGLHTR